MTSTKAALLWIDTTIIYDIDVLARRDEAVVLQGLRSR